MAIAALGRAGRNMRRRRLSGRDDVVVAQNAVSVGWPVRVGSAGKRVGARMTRFARQRRRNMIAGLA